MVGRPAGNAGKEGPANKDAGDRKELDTPEFPSILALSHPGEVAEGRR